MLRDLHEIKPKYAMKRIATWCLAIALSSIAVTCMAASGSSFVTVNGTHFVRDGKPYYIVGTNMWYGGYLGSTSKVGDRARLAKELDTLKSLGINNLRVMAMSENSAIAGAVHPAIMNGFGLYDEELLRGMDYFLSELGKRNMTAVLYLNNYWQWSGGFSQYLSWLDGKPMLDPNETHDYPAFMTHSATFYRNKRANDEYRSTIKKVVLRTNSVTGKRYVDDPTILSWQLANEPRPGFNNSTSDDDKKVFIQWIDETAKYIHQLDSKHLVSSGNEGIRGCVDDEQLTIDSNKTRYVDYVTFHLWPRNWSWYDQHQSAKTWDVAMKRSIDYLNWHIDAANKLNKPVVLEEFGLDRDDGSYDPKSTTQYRDKFYREVFDVLYQRAKKGDSSAGFNFWTWNGAGRAHHDDYWWKTGDEFNGDPPQEQQGMYGVFDSDVSTIAVIREFAEKYGSLH
jgi:mannan endo-1,4-beta-mannosidase